jgi:hypothetical protein
MYNILLLAASTRMPIGFLLNTTLHASSWLIMQSYYGISYMIYGPQTDPVMTRLEKIENELTRVTQAKQDLEYYWNNRSKFTKDKWIIISAANLIKECDSKWNALTTISDHNQLNPYSKYTLLQVGSESNTQIHI